MRQTSKAKEERLVLRLNGRRGKERYGALRTISERGGPGAVPLLSSVLEGKSPAKEKIKAAQAIRRIAYRTGIYYEGIAALENASHGDQPASVRSAARRSRERIAGDRYIATCPDCRIDERILVSPKEKRTPDFLKA